MQKQKNDGKKEISFFFSFFWLKVVFEFRNGEKTIWKKKNILLLRIERIIFQGA